MKKFKGVILALALVMGIGMVKPVEAHAYPTDTNQRAWLEYDVPMNKVTGTWVGADVRFRPMGMVGSRVNVNSLRTGKAVGSIHYSYLEKNYTATGKVNFRSAPSVANGTILAYIPKGASLLVMSGMRGSTGTWKEVSYLGKIGYVSRDYLEVKGHFLVPINQEVY